MSTLDKDGVVPENKVKSEDDAAVTPPGNKAPLPAESMYANDWFAGQIKEYQKTGTVDIDGADARYLNTPESYYKDPIIREELIKQFGTDDPMVFGNYYKAIQSEYQARDVAEYDAIVAELSSAPDLTTSEGISRSDITMVADVNQMMYDNYRWGNGVNTVYSNREGQSDKVLTPEGDVLHVDKYSSMSALKADPKLKNKKGDSPIAFRYADSGGKGGSLVPVYSGEAGAHTIASDWDIMDYTHVYSESNFVKAALQSIPNMLNDGLNGVFQAVPTMILDGVMGENAQYIDWLTAWKDAGMYMASHKLSQSDKAEVFGNAESLAILAADIVSQLGGAFGAAKGVTSLAAKGGKALNSAGMLKHANTAGAYASRYYMVSLSMSDIIDQGRAMGLSREHIALLSMSVGSALWWSFSKYNLVEHSLFNVKGMDRAIRKHNTDFISALGRTGKGLKETLHWSEKLSQSTKHVWNNLDLITAGGGVGKQLAQASATEATQEVLEFMIEEGGKNASNLYRYWIGEIDGATDADKKFAWVGDERYFQEVFLPGAGMSMVGGALGGPGAKGLFRMFGTKFDPKINNIVSHAIMRGDEVSLAKAMDYMDKKKAFGSTKLSTDIDADGQFMDLAAAKEINPNAMTQYDFNRAVLEDYIHQQKQVHEALGIRGNVTQAIQESSKFQEYFAKHENLINQYEVSKDIKDAHDIVDSKSKKGLHINNIIQVKDAVAELNQTYYDTLKSAENAEERDQAEAEREEKTEELVNTIADTDNQMTKQDARELLGAVQTIQNVMSGKYGERYFVKSIYQIDVDKKRKDPAAKRMFEKLDSDDKDVSTVDKIFNILNTMSKGRDYNDNQRATKQRVEKKNEEIISGPGTLVDKVNALEDFNGIYYMSEEMHTALDAELSESMLEAYKESWKKGIEDLSIDDYASIDRFFNKALEMQAEGKVWTQADQSVYYFIEGDAAEGNFTFNPEAVLQAIKEELTSKVDAMTSIEAINDLDILITKIGNHPGERGARYEKVHRHPVVALKIRKAAEESPTPELQAGNTWQSISDKIKNAPNTTDEDLTHMYAESDDQGEYKEGSNLSARINNILAEARERKSKISGSNNTTFSDWDSVREMLDATETRLEMFNFMDSIESRLAAFRANSTDNDWMISFRNREKYDQDLTKFNRTFERTMYNPARAAYLANKENRTPKEEFEYQKLLRLRNGYTVVDPKEMTAYTEAQEKLSNLEKELVAAQKRTFTSDETLADLQAQITEQEYILYNLSLTSVKGNLTALKRELEGLLTTEANAVTTDQARKEDFVSFISDTVTQVRASFGFLHERVGNMAPDQVQAMIESDKLYAEFFNLEEIIPNITADPDAEVAMGMAIEVASRLYTDFGDQTGTLTRMFPALLAEYRDQSISTLVDPALLMRTLRFISTDFKTYTGRYKKYINLDSEDGLVAHFAHPANSGQFIAGYQGYTYLSNQNYQQSHKEFNAAFYELGDDIMNRFTPESTFLVQGKPGSGKSALVGAMIIKMMLEDRQDQDPTFKANEAKVLVAANVIDQAKTLQKALTDAGIKQEGSPFLIGTTNDSDRPSSSNIVSHLETMRNSTMEDISVIVIDEATHLPAVHYAKLTKANKDLISESPDHDSFNASLKAINSNRAAEGIPPIQVVLMGDNDQNGAVVKNSRNVKIPITVMNNKLLAKSSYLERSERSRVATLNASLDNIMMVAKLGNSLGFGGEGGMGVQVKSIDLKYGYDKDNNHLLGIAKVGSMNSLSNAEALPGLDKSVVDILTTKLASDEKYTVAIATNVFHTKAEIIGKYPALENLFKEDASFAERVIIKTHEAIQGKEYSYTLVHLDTSSFGLDFGANTPNLQINGRDLNTSASRSNYGSLIISEVNYPIESEFVEGEKAPSTKDIEDDTNSLRTLQANSFANVPTQFAGTETDSDTDQEDGDEETEADVDSDTADKDNEELEWKFSIKSMKADFEDGKGFTIPDNFDPENEVHKKYIYQKGLVHILGHRPQLDKMSAPELQNEYEKILAILHPDIDSFLDSIDNGNLDEYKAFHKDRYEQYLHVKKLNGDYTDIEGDVYIGDMLEVVLGDGGIGFKMSLDPDRHNPEISEAEKVVVPFLMGENLESQDKAVARYVITGERVVVMEETGFGYGNVGLQDYAQGSTIFVVQEQDYEHSKDNDDNTEIPSPEINSYNQRQFGKINAILKRANSVAWKKRHEDSSRPEEDILEDIIVSENETDEIKAAAVVRLQLMGTIDESDYPHIDRDAFFERIAIHTDSMISKDPVEAMKNLDVKGIISIYTEGMNKGGENSLFNSYTKGVAAGVPSLVQTARYSLVDSGKYEGEFKVAEASKEYSSTVRDLILGNKEVTQFVTYAYRAFEEDGTTERHTTMMIGAVTDQGDGKGPLLYVIGHLNTIGDPGPNLKKAQAAASKSYSEGNYVMGRWDPHLFRLMYNTDKSLTSGKPLVGPKKTVAEITKIIVKAGGIVGDVKIIMDSEVGKEHAGKAILPYSMDPNDTGINIADMPLTNDPDLGLFKGARGAIILDPAYISLVDIYNRLKKGDPSKPIVPSVFVETISMNHVGTNLTATMIDLVTKWATTTNNDGLENYLKSLADLKSEAKMPKVVESWDESKLTAVVNQVGHIENKMGEMSAEQAAMLTLVDLLRPHNRLGYLYKDDEVDTTTFGKAVSTRSWGKPITFLSNQIPGGLEKSYLNFDFQALVHFVRGYAAGAGAAKVSPYAGNIGAIKTSDGKLVTDTIAKADLIIAAMSKMLTQSNQFKLGIRLLPVLTGKYKRKTTPIASGLNLGAINQKDIVGFTANVREIDYPLVHLTATKEIDGNTYNIWDSGNHVAKDSALDVEDEFGTSSVTVRDVEIPLNVTDNLEDFTEFMKGSGIEAEFNGMTGGVLTASLNEFGIELMEAFEDATFLNDYITDLKSRINTGKPVTEDKYTAAKFVADPANFNLSTPEGVELANTVRTVHTLLPMAGSFDTIREAEVVLQESLLTIGQLGLEPEEVVRFTEAIEDVLAQYSERSIDFDGLDFDKAVSDTLNSGNILSEVMFDEDTLENKEATTFELVTAYLSTRDEAIKDILREKIDIRHAASLKLLYFSPSLPSANVEDMFSLTRPSHRANARQKYKNEREGYLANMKKGDFPIGSIGLGITDVLYELKGDPTIDVEDVIERLTNSVVSPNIFNIDRHFQSTIDPVGDKILLDRLLISQFAQAFKDMQSTIGVDPVISSYFEDVVDSLVLRYNSILDATSMKSEEGTKPEDLHAKFSGLPKNLAKMHYTALIEDIALKQNLDRNTVALNFGLLLSQTNRFLQGNDVPSYQFNSFASIMQMPINWGISSNSQYRDSLKRRMNSLADKAKGIQSAMQALKSKINEKPPC